MFPEHPESTGGTSEYYPLNVINIAGRATFANSKLFFFRLGHFLLVSFPLFSELSRVLFEDILDVLNRFFVEDVDAFAVTLDFYTSFVTCKILHIFVKWSVIFEALNPMLCKIVFNFENFLNVFYVLADQSLGLSVLLTMEF